MYVRIIYHISNSAEFIIHSSTGGGGKCKKPRQYNGTLTVAGIIRRVHHNYRSILQRIQITIIQNIFIRFDRLLFKEK